MKKYTIIGLIGLIIVLGIGAYMWQTDKLQLSSDTGRSFLINNRVDGGDLWSYVPADGDQILYMQIDDELIAVAQKMQETQGFDAELDDVLEPLSELIVYQYASGLTTVNLLFLEGSSELSVEQIQNLGVVSEADGFVYEQLNDTMRVYGDTAALDYLTSYNGEFSSDRDDIQKFLQAFRAGGYNLGFFSTPLSDMPVGNPMVGAFSQQLQYTIAMSHMRLENPFGRVIMQFEDGVIKGNPQPFDAELTTYTNENPILYVEMADIMSMAGIDDQQIQMFLPVLLGQSNPALGSLLTTEEYTLISEALRENIAISLTSQEGGILGAGIQIVFSTAGMYDVLAKLAPLWKGLAAPIAGGMGNVQENIVGDTITFTLGGGEADTGTFAPLPPLPLVTISKTADVSYITILQDQLLMNEAGLALPYSDRTRLVFTFDNQQLLTALQNSPLFQLSQQVPLNENFFEGGVVVGSLDAIPENGQITISFSVE